MAETPEREQVARIVYATLHHLMRVNGTEAQNAYERVADGVLAMLGEHVGEAAPMPGSNGGFTMAAFRSIDVPVGTKLYALPAPPAIKEET
jgi:hypothetical protein